MFRSSDDPPQQNSIDSSGLMHLIATGGSTNVTDHNNDESVVNTSTDEQLQLPDENLPIEEHHNIINEEEDDEGQQQQELQQEEEEKEEEQQQQQPPLQQKQEQEQHKEEEEIHEELQQENHHEDDEDDEEEEAAGEDEEHEEHEPEQEHQELPLDPSTAISLPMETEHEPSIEEPAVPSSNPDDQTQPATKPAHNIAEIHREMLNLIPIPDAWSHIRHQSGLFSYPDLPHFNVIRQATFRDGRFVCPFCTVDFASKEGIRYHLYNSCTKSPYPKAFFRCLMCGSELADRSSLRTHLARHGADENGNINTDKIDVSRKPALSSTNDTGNSKKSKKKKKTSNDLAQPQMINPMLAMTSNLPAARGMESYNLPPTMLNPQMSLPIIKSDLNDSDSKRKRGRPPKTKGDGPTPVAPYTKHQPMNPTGLTLTPTINSQIIINDPQNKLQNDPTKSSLMRSPRGVDISSELAELARSRMREHIEFATDSLLPEQEHEINNRLRTEGVVQCHRCRGKAQFNTLKKLKEHLKTDCPLGPGKNSSSLSISNHSFRKST